MTNISTEDFLAHYGVKGMRWGVRKENELTRRDQAVINKLAPHGYSEDRMFNHYGLDDPGATQGLSDKQKKLLIGGAVGVGVVALAATAILGRRYVNAKTLRNVLPNKNLVKDAGEEFVSKKFDDFIANASKSKLNLTPSQVRKLSKKRYVLPPGHIVKRVSTTAEDTPRSKGFFASINDADTDRYKAVMPAYWKKWNYPDRSGFVNSYRAKEEIRVASQKDAFDVFRNMMDDVVTEARDSYAPTRARVEEGFKLGLIDKAAYDSAMDYMKPSPPIRVRDIIAGPGFAGDSDTAARLYFNQFSQSWALTEINTSPVRDSFFQKLKELNFNAVLDVNDAGALADAPVRFLDGNLFEIVENAPLTPAMIKQMQESILAL